MESDANPQWLQLVDRYYTDKLATHGATPKGVDWNSQESQELRFSQLCRVLGDGGSGTINDIGCGYGQLFSFFEARGMRPNYLGVDVSQAMIDAARTRIGERSNTRFLCATVPDRTAQYSLASGIFNVRLSVPDAEWSQYVLATLDMMARHSSVGFAFNCLTRYSDPEYMRPDLYYADPCALFDHCKRHYSRNVALLHDYDLYEFTLIIRNCG